MFNSPRLKVQLKLCISRLKMLQGKKASLNQQSRREIAALLEKGKVQSARIRVEHIIRDDLLQEAMESLELYCDLLLARFGLLEQYKTCEPSLEVAVNTIIWAAPRVGEAKELGLVRDQLAAKFGKEFMLQALENEDERVDPKVVMRLGVNAPEPFLVERYLEEIARSYDVPWLSDILVHDDDEEEEKDDNDNQSSDGGGGGGGQAELLPPLQNPEPKPNTEQDLQFDLPEIPSISPLKKPTKKNKTLTEEESSSEVDETIPEAKKVPTDFKTTSVTLIQKLLQFSTPRLDSKIVNVLFLEGMMDILMSHVSRLNPTAMSEDIDLKDCHLSEKIEYTQHERDITDLDAMKRSYHAMELLSGTTANHLWVQNSKFYTIVQHLSDMFLPNSNGNFHHFFKIFQHMARRNPCDMLDFVILRNNATILFDYMLPYIKEGPVMEAVLNLVFVRDINPETKAQRETAHKELQKLGFLEWMIEAIQLKEASQVDNGDVLFASLKTERGLDMIELLANTVIKNPPSRDRERTIHIIRLLVKRTIATAAAITQPIQGPLYNISIHAQTLLSKYIPDFCLIFNNDRSSPVTKSKPLSSSDMELIDIIYQILYNANDKNEMLASINSSFWKFLVNSFFEKSIVCLVLTTNYEPALLALIRKQYLVTRLIDEYQDKKQTRGFILLILNQLRLMSDAHHSELITRIIINHPRFQEFLPTLREQTLAQTEPIYSWKLDACPRPPAHLGPSPPIQVVHFSPYTGTLPLMSNAPDNDETSGIDLGSDFAYCLGFKEGPRNDGMETPFSYLSRRNSYHSDSQSDSFSSSHSNTKEMYFSEDEDIDCPLCMEELDIADRNFKPCPCGYQICRFCWHHIRENLNGRCPACRREYSDQNAEFQPVSADEIARIRRERKEKERQQKDMETANRRHLASMRVVQKNLVYIIGLHPKLATEEANYFGQFGKIAKIVINKRQIAPTSHANGTTTMQPSAAVYVTYVKKDDATKAIHAVDGSVMVGRILRASYGTTKYCTYYLRNMACPNPNCLYLHEPGEDADTISKEELATGTHRMRDQISQEDDSEDEYHGSQSSSYHASPSISHADYPPGSSKRSNASESTHRTSNSMHMDDERSALPATASWAKTGNSTPATPTLKSSVLPGRTLVSDAFGPPLSALAAQQQQLQKQPLSPSALKRKLEKKKRKELQKQKKEEEQLQTQTQQQPQEHHQQEAPSIQKEEGELYNDLVKFVLGDAFKNVLPPQLPVLDPQDEPVGVSELYSGSEDEEERHSAVTPEIQLERLSLSEGMSPLEYLTQSTPIPAYSGTFNPFSNSLGKQSQVFASPPTRKHSRFGFAQF
ncbi:hypothetical protein K501DRAFT_189620 [Backusella circina FSU 941]|nr:hypothetical protein K501DRAFT_189620 [Backusella circina FSU 941]